MIKRRRRAYAAHRPPMPPCETINVSMPDWLAAGIKAEADQKKRSVSWIVTDALIDYFSLHATARRPSR